MIFSKAVKQLCLTTLFTALSVSTAFAADAGQASGVNVNVRATVGMNGAVLGKISQGTEFTVLQKDGNWFKISYNGQEAFVSADYFGMTKAEGTINSYDVNLREKATSSSDSLGKFAEGDKVTVTGQTGDWYRISYNGGSAYVNKEYVSGTYVSAVPNVEGAVTEAAEKTKSYYGMVTASGGLRVRKEASLNSVVLTVLPYGTEVTVDRVGSEWIRIITDAGQKGYVSAEFLSVREGERTTRSNATGKGAEVVAYAKQFIGTPYVWGGTNLNSGVDCSGFVYSVMKNFGITLNRSSYEMVNNGVAVAKSELAPGDLVFFNAGGNSRISHVGIYIGGGQYIHSTNGGGRGVCIADLNSKYSTSTYVTARRVLR